jgi:hypothetical protein
LNGNQGAVVTSTSYSFSGYSGTIDSSDCSFSGTKAGYIEGSSFGSAMLGDTHCTWLGSCYSAIGGGNSNYICGSPFSVIVTGAGSYTNSIYGGQSNVIVTGANCSLNNGASRSVALGGVTTSIRTMAVYYLSKSNGSFVINHPDPSKNATHKLQHTFVESPTGGDNIYRFRVKTTNSQGILELPSYYKYLNENTHIHISPIDNIGVAYGKVTSDCNCVNLCSNIDGHFDVIIFGTRKDAVKNKFWRGAERIINQ